LGSLQFIDPYYARVAAKSGIAIKPEAKITIADHKKLSKKDSI
jgi:hypothetical protein